MELRYSSIKLRKRLESMRNIEKHYGKHARHIMSALNQLQAAKCLEDVPTCKPLVRHKLHGDYEGCWAVWVSKNYRLVFQPTGDFDVNDLKTITVICILDITDYH